MKKAVIGLSGGVDSAVAAALLKEQGYAVTGLFLDAGITSSEAARESAELLGIDFAVADIRKDLEEKVCSAFANAYLSGKTPNPCIICNPSVKFPAIAAYADSIGAEYIATGHYAICKNGVLFRSAGENDQSYMLCRLPEDILNRLLLPLGSFKTKADVRKKAAELNLSCAESPDSMEICFIPDGDYASYIEARGTVPPAGNFVDKNGKILGRHKGIHHYTVGQRRRLGIAMGERMFVSSIDGENNSIVLSPVSDMSTREAAAGNVFPALPAESFRADVRVRHSKSFYPAQIFPTDTGAKIVFDEAVRPPTPGQTAVFYAADGSVIACGEIE